MNFSIDHSDAFLHKYGYYRLVSACPVRGSLWWPRAMVDIPERTDDAADIIIFGVESEQIEEENDALNDMRYELGEILTNDNGFENCMLTGIHRDREDELEELMPSCFCLNMVDCITIRISSVFCQNKRWAFP